MRLFKPPRIANWIFPRYTWRFSVSDSSIFLTFDDGPHPDITPFVLDLLKKYQWKATFFCVGDNAQAYPEIMERIRKEGHAIGNHTQKHVNAYKVSGETYLESIQNFNRHTPTTLFRPPYGRLKPSLAREISKTHRIMMWSWLSYDYDLSVSDTQILEEVRRIKPGNILVLHDNYKLKERQQTLLPALFARLAEKGFASREINGF